jgi:DNA-binding FrmR family transcriptional regulator
MKLANPELQEKLTQRLRRIEGQVRGVEAMLGEQRDCREIIQQLSAIQSALHGFTRTLLEDYAVECLLPSEGEPLDRRAQEQVLKDLIDMFNKAL